MSGQDLRIAQVVASACQCLTCHTGNSKAQAACDAPTEDVAAADCVSYVLHVQGGENLHLGKAAWQADCVLLLWLSQLLLIPFDLATVDSSMAQEAQDCRCCYMLQRLGCLSTIIESVMARCCLHSP